MAEDTEWIYDYVVQIIKSPEFRNPIKDFIDENCGSFIGEDENTFEQGGLYKEFVMLVENLLEASLKELGVTDEMFCLAAKKGLEHPEDKKYFEQLISFTNYVYFKNMMTKRNLQLEELAYNEMKAKLEANKGGNNQEQIKQIEEMRVKKEKEEMEYAIKMSLALEEEIRKLKAIEELELKKAIHFSQLSSPINNPIAKAYQNNSKPIESKKEEKAKITMSIPVQVKEDKKIVESRIQAAPIPKDETKKQENKVEKPQLIIPNLFQTPVDKVCKKEQNKELKYEAGKKATPLSSTFTAEENAKKVGETSLKNSLNELEREKQRKLREYKEMIMKMKKDQRKEKEIKPEDDILNDKDLNDEVKRRLALRRQLAEKLKKINQEKIKDSTGPETK